MKPILIPTLPRPDLGMHVQEKSPGEHRKEWHIHNEYELLYVSAGKVHLFIGDKETHLKNGDLVLIGAKLPHLAEVEEDTKTMSLYFEKSNVLDHLHAISDLSKLDLLLEKAILGIQFFPSDLAIGSLLRNLKESSGVDKVILLFQLFKNLLLFKDHKVLCSEGFVRVSSTLYTEDRLKNVNDYIKMNISKKITLDDLADIANMSAPAFCNFFKKRTSKTVFQYLNELRIGYAKKLIIESEMTVSEIAGECGYTSITFFNRQFKKLTQKPPTEYRKAYAMITA